MLGAICGDIIGSVYERDNIKNKEFELFDEECRFTDDTVMTIAVSKACREYMENRNAKQFEDNCIKYMQKLGRENGKAGYGGRFIYWLIEDNPKPYYSYGNGSAMRVSPVGWTANTLKEAEELAKASAEVTHNHPDGIAGAQAVAGSIWLLRNGKSKEDIKKYVEAYYYDLDFSIDEIRPTYRFDVSCKGSVPEAIKCFLEGNDFEDCIRNAISIGGDSDTIGAITGSLAEAYYGIPEEIKEKAFTYLTPEFKQDVNDFYNSLSKKNNKEERDER